MEDKPVDRRDVIYRDLHAQLDADETKNRHSARAILGILFKEFMPESVLDVGCGLGTWLSVAREMGVHDIQGVDGAWLDKSRLRVPGQFVRILDLEVPFNLQRRFDLAISLEVAEHLPERSAVAFVTSLTSHSDVVLFSAAVPLQGGHHHVNEQWPDYWCAMFSGRGFDVVDCIRGRIWTDSSIHFWLRQNTFLFVNRHLLDAGGFSSLLKNEHPLSLVHPELYLGQMRQAQAGLSEYKEVLKLLSAGGNFHVKPESDGRITITRVPPKA